MEMRYCLLLLAISCSLILSLSDASFPTLDDSYGELRIPSSPDDEYIDPMSIPDVSEPGLDEYYVYGTIDGEDSDYEPEPEKDPCADLTGRDRIICERKQIITGHDEHSNPCDGLSGRDRGLCERDENRRERERENGDNPCEGLRGRARGKCERDQNRRGHERDHPDTDDNGDNPCEGLRGRERGKCEKKQRRGGQHGHDDCSGLRGPRRRECNERHAPSPNEEDIGDVVDLNTAGPKEVSIHEPLGTDRIRLTGNSSYYNGGLVKIFRNNSWGYVCDDDWDMKDANVACKQLGYNRGAAEFVSSSWYGEAKDAFYLMDDVKCSGDEKQLQKCLYNRNHDCLKDEAAGVICNLNTGCDEKWIAGPTGCYRLFSGSTSRYSAENKCKSINGHLVKIETKEENDFLNTILRVREAKHYWLTDGIKERGWVWKSDNDPISTPFWFPGWEPQSQFPKPSNNLLMRCVALANAYKYGSSKYLTNYFYWDNVNCNKVDNFVCETEKTTPVSIANCYSGIGTDYRGSEAETVKGTPCLKWTKSRKINPTNHPDAGLGDHNYCRNPDGDSRPWCWVNTRRNLFGYCDIAKCSTNPETTSETPTTTTTKATTTVLATTTAAEDSINCPRDEMYCSSSETCISLSWKCDKEMDCAGGEDEMNCDYKLPLFEKQDRRFTIREDPIEVYVSMPLETCARMCVNHRKFACKAFYYEELLSHCSLFDTNQGGSSFFPISGTYYVLTETCDENDFHCDIGKCVPSDKVCDQHNDCGDFSDEKKCATPEKIEVRLSEGPDEHSGRVEIKYLGEWGIICDDGWDIKDANVVCKMLGYPAAESAYLENTITTRDRDFFLANVDCTGNETSLLGCKRDPWGSHQCKPHEVVGIVCQIEKVCPSEKFTCASSKRCVPLSYICDGEEDCSDGSDEKQCAAKVELVGGTSDLSGRVEITRGGVKGSVCDDDFDNKDATVICRMMGYRSGRQIKNTFGKGQGPIWLDDLNCDGSEIKLDRCAGLRWGQNDCTHEEDVAIRCFTDADTTVRPTTEKTPTKPTTHNDLTCGKRPRAPRTRRDERTVAKPHLSRIVGGTTATYGMYPWQVGIRIVSSVQYDGSKSSSHWCGATILDNLWVISAAHCFPKKVKKDNVLIRTGDLNGKIWDTHEQSFDVKYLIPHPRYSIHTYDYDIALIKLKPDKKGDGIIFNDYVQPACLPPDDLVNSPGSRCEISGWGSTGQIYPSLLKAATIPLLPRRTCKRVYKDLTQRMMCAGYLEGGIDTCQGDSGGPLVCDINGVHTLVGITSWGNGCAKANYPGVYTNVSYFKSWIESTIAKYS